MSKFFALHALFECLGILFNKLDLKDPISLNWLDLGLVFETEEQPHLQIPGLVKEGSLVGVWVLYPRGGQSSEG